VTGSIRQIHIDDLAHPRLPWPIRAGNALARPLLPRLVRFDEAELLAAASKRTGLADFGDGGFRDPLTVLLRALEREAHLTPLGCLMARQFLLQLLWRPPLTVPGQWIGSTGGESRTRRHRVPPVGLSTGGSPE